MKTYLLRDCYLFKLLMVLFSVFSLPIYGASSKRAADSYSVDKEVVTRGSSSDSHVTGEHCLVNSTPSSCLGIQTSSSHSSTEEEAERAREEASLREQIAWYQSIIDTQFYERDFERAKNIPPEKVIEHWKSHAEATSLPHLKVLLAAYQNKYHSTKGILNLADKRGCTLLHHAIRRGDISTLRWAIEEGDSMLKELFTAVDKEEQTPMDWAIKKKDYSAAQYILNFSVAKGIEVEGIVNKYTPAQLSKFIEQFECLAKQVQCLRRINSCNVSPLLTALQPKSPTKATSITRTDQKEAEEEKTEEQGSSLEEQLNALKREIDKVILGLDPKELASLTDEQVKKEWIEYAKKGDYLSLLAFMLVKGKRLPAAIEDKQGYSAFYYAISHNHMPLLNDLLATLTEETQGLLIKPHQTGATLMDFAFELQHFRAAGAIYENCQRFGLSDFALQKYAALRGSFKKLMEAEVRPVGEPQKGEKSKAQPSSKKSNVVVAACLSLISFISPSASSEPLQRESTVSLPKMGWIDPLESNCSAQRELQNKIRIYWKKRSSKEYGLCDILRSRFLISWVLLLRSSFKMTEKLLFCHQYAGKVLYQLSLKVEGAQFSEFKEVYDIYKNNCSALEGYYKEIVDTLSVSPFFPRTRLDEWIRAGQESKQQDVQLPDNIRSRIFDKVEGIKVLKRAFDDASNLNFLLIKRTLCSLGYDLIEKLFCDLLKDLSLLKSLADEGQSALVPPGQLAAIFTDYFSFYPSLISYWPKCFFRYSLLREKMQEKEKLYGNQPSLQDGSGCSGARGLYA